MNVRTLKKHREPVKDCPQPDSREINAPADFAKFWRGYAPAVEACANTEPDERSRSAIVGLVRDVAFAAWNAAKQKRGEADTRRLDWLERCLDWLERQGTTDIDYVTDFRSLDAEFEIADVHGNAVRAKRLRDALDKAMKRWPHN